MPGHDRFTYICISCRFVSKYSGVCPSCRVSLRGMYDLNTPKKNDDKGWKKIELVILTIDSGLQLCDQACCVPIRSDFNKLTLSQFKARIRRRRTHRQGGVPKYYSYR